MISAIKGMLEKNPKKRITLQELSSIFKIKINKCSMDQSLNNKALTYLNSLGFSRKLVIQYLKDQRVNHLTALYKLLSTKF